MEKAYWLGRKRASLKLAQDAASSEARMVHYELARRYNMKALSAETRMTDFANAMPRSVRAPCSSPEDESAGDA